MEVLEVSSIPPANETSYSIGRHLEGYRIGFDAGGSDRKVSAVIDGTPVYSEEVVWYPKVTEDPDYHYQEIVSALRTAASYMPRVDGIGISSAGVYVANRTMVASLFLKVPENLFNSKVKDIFLRAGREIGDVPVVVCNDGDVTALAGAMSLNTNNILGIAMGTSEAVGYVDDKGNITGWLNELAFAPVDASPKAMADEWSGDIGCGVKYFSQDSIIKLALSADIEFDDAQTPAEKLKVVQVLLEKGDSRANDVYESLGVYLGHTLPFYYSLYGFSKVLLLGRVMGGKGGDIILHTSHKVLEKEYPDMADMFSVSLPDEKSRRVGQSVAAASLPIL
jgi:predicted NBD/HSP70 family sugar kinase